jgi:ATP-dependent RNA helicase RhlE
MDSFSSINLSKPLFRAIDEMGFSQPTPIQQEAYSVISSGRDIVGIAQTGTGKTLAYLMPILNNLNFIKDNSAPRVLIIVPTRELVVQVLKYVEDLIQYKNLRVFGVYGDTNINTQIDKIADGGDILVATPGRLYDLILCKAVKIKSVQKLILDEVDVLLDLGFRLQLQNIFDLLPEKRQNIMFSATMTDEVELLIQDYFILPIKIQIAISGEPLKSIHQSCYSVRNFLTKINLLAYLLSDQQKFDKVLVFVSSKNHADKIFDALQKQDITKLGIIHSNKSHNTRVETLEKFERGDYRILISTDVISRGLDFKNLSYVINFDTPNYPENYIHRIGRTGRANHVGNSILFFTEVELEYKLAIEELMNYEIPELDLPDDVQENYQLIADEIPKIRTKINRNEKTGKLANAFHEKSDKNKKVNLGGSYRRELAAKYKKPLTKGDKYAKKKKK